MGKAHNLWWMTELCELSGNVRIIQGVTLSALYYKKSELSSNHLPPYKFVLEEYFIRPPSLLITMGNFVYIKPVLKKISSTFI